MQLDGKKIFITGGTGGIGKPLVTLLRQAGAFVDVYDRKAQGDLVEKTDAVCSKLAVDTPDILINLAGYNDFNYCENQDAESLLKINLTIPIQLTQAVLPAMKRRGSGQVINIGSMTALIPLPHLTCYVASKAGLKGFSDALRREVDGTGVHITHITPRAVDTDANKGLKKILNERTGVNHDCADVVALRILKAIVKKERDVRIGWPERFFAILNFLIPGIIDHGLKKNRDIGEELLRQNKTTKSEDTKMKNILKTLALASVLLLTPAPVFAQGVEAQSAPVAATVAPQQDQVIEKIADLQTRWAEIKYRGADKNAQAIQMALLGAEARELAAAYPDRAEPKIWQAIILSTEAGFIKGLSALPKVKAAKSLLEAAAAIDPQALQGSAYTSLGSLYYQVPGWPIGFGDGKKAEKYLRSALKMNPDSIDANYFYGDFLVHEERYDEAVPVLERALIAPDRPGRALADEGRRQEIRAALDVAKKHSILSKKEKFN